MNKLLICLFLLPSISLSQTTFKSLASEYFYQDLSSNFEWLERDIIISNETIIVKSYGSEATVIQTWEIQNASNVKYEDRTLQVINVHLASGEEYEYPATFTKFYNDEGIVDVITCEIPPNSQMKLADGAPITVRFLID